MTDLQQPQNEQPKSQEDKRPKPGDRDNNIIKAKAAPDKQPLADDTKPDGKPKSGSQDAKQESAAEKYDLATFSHLCPLQETDFHAFRCFFLAEGHHRRTLADWEKKLQDFLGRPV